QFAAELKAYITKLKPKDQTFVQSLLGQLDSKGDISPKQWYWVGKMHKRALASTTDHAPVAEGIEVGSQTAPQRGPAPSSKQPVDPFQWQKKSQASPPPPKQVGPLWSVISFPINLIIFAVAMVIMAGIVYGVAGFFSWIDNQWPFAG